MNRKTWAPWLVIGKIVVSMLSFVCAVYFAEQGDTAWTLVALYTSWLWAMPKPERGATVNANTDNYNIVFVDAEALPEDQIARRDEMLADWIKRVQKKGGLS